MKLNMLFSERTTQLALLHEKLSECEDAHYKPGEESTCLEGTRINLREQTMHWIEDNSEDQPGLLWLRGKAGSGKSTIANTIAKTVEDRKYNLSCFFCKRDDPNLSNPCRVLSTLAYRFAQQHESYRTALFQLFHDGTRGAGIAATADVDTQFEKLFKEPLAQMVQPSQPHVVVIDALDECGSSKEQKSLATCILALSCLAPWIKVFVTSRAEPAIRNVFAEDVCVRCNINKESGTDDDIRKYIERQVEKLEFKLSPPQVGELVKRAEGLFIWCSTLFRYLGARLAPARRETLEFFLSGEHQRSGSWVELYRLYEKVLESAVKDVEDKAFMDSILTIINIAARNRPLSSKAIISFLHASGQHGARSEVHAQAVFQELHAVLYVDQSTTGHGAVRAYHTSFYDFLQLKASNDARKTTHSHIFRHCIHILNTELHFNICSIEKPILNKDVPGLTERVARTISEELQYSSRYWFTHLSLSNLTQSDAVHGVRDLLCSIKLLFWLECLSLQGSLMRYSLAFAACSSFFQVSDRVSPRMTFV